MPRRDRTTPLPLRGEVGWRVKHKRRPGAPGSAEARHVCTIFFRRIVGRV
jgi:hypothetical protein